MRRPASLRQRLVAAAIAWIAAAVLLASFAVSAAFRDQARVQFDDELAAHLDELQRLAQIEPDGSVRLRAPLSDPLYEAPLSGYYWEIQRDGNVLARSPSLQGPLLHVPADAPQDLGRHVHLIDGPTGALRIMDRSYWPDAAQKPILFVIGADQRHLDNMVARFNKTLAWSMGAFALSMIAAAALLIFVALRPLAVLRQRLAAARVGPGKQVHGEFPAEVQPLVDELNAMIDASGNHVRQARAQAGNLAHAMKTSLAVLADEADRIEKKGLPQSAAVILEHCRRMQIQIDHQIARARAAAMRAVPGIAAPLGTAVDDVVRALARLYEEKGIEITRAVPGGVKVACDAQDLNEMLANLVDNACKHAKSAVRLSLAGDPDGKFVDLVVEDDGPGLPPEAWEVVFRAGERWDSRAPGSGLGLTIVQELATLYGGQVSLDHAALGGLRVTLRLPRAA